MAEEPKSMQKEIQSRIALETISGVHEQFFHVLSSKLCPPGLSLLLLSFCTCILYNHNLEFKVLLYFVEVLFVLRESIVWRKS